MGDAAALSIPLKNLKNNRHREFSLLSAAIVKKCKKDDETKKNSSRELLQVSKFIFILFIFFLKNHKRQQSENIYLFDFY